MVRNVVLLCLDSVRKDYFDQYATRLQNRAGTEFSSARSASSWSSPSHASMLTGLLPHQHGVHAEHNDFSNIVKEETLTGDLVDHHSIGVSANVFASSRYGFDQFFDEFHEVSTGRRFSAGLDANEFFLNNEHGGLRVGMEYLPACARSDNMFASLGNGLLAGVNLLTRDAPIPKLLDDGAASVSRTIKDAVAQADEPVLVFANYTDVHIPLRPIRAFNSSLYSVPDTWSTDEVDQWDVMGAPEEYDQYLRYHRELYGAAIEYLDRKVEALYDDLQKQTERETTVVVTADHGENLGYPEDEGLVGHKSSLSESLLHVPFAVLNPPEGYDTIENSYFSHLDLRELLRAFAAGAAPACFRERIPAEVVGASPGPDPPSRHQFWNRMIRCVYEGDRKVVWDSLGDVDAYRIDLNRPCWQKLLDEDVDVPTWASDYFQTDVCTYKKEQQAVTTTGEDVDSFTEQRLRDLGYM